MSTISLQLPLRTAVAMALAVGAAAASAQERPVYRCPGNLYTDQYSAKEAADLGCKMLDGAPVTVVQSTSPVRRPSSAVSNSGGGEGSGSRTASGAAPAVRASGEMRVDPAQQRARDSDARRILEAELRKEAERLAALQKDYNQGEPERRGDERNYARYQERVAEMKSSIARKEADIAALKRELAKLPAP